MVLGQVHTRAPLQVSLLTTAIFPHYTASVVKVRLVFTEVRKLLRNQQGVHYGILFPAQLCIMHSEEEKEFLYADRGDGQDRYMYHSNVHSKDREAVILIKNTPFMMTSIYLRTRLL